MSELKFTRVNNEEYKTISFFVENAFIPITEDDYKIINTEKTKFGYKKATLRLINSELIDKLKSWETQINDYLKVRVSVLYLFYTQVGFTLKLLVCCQMRKNTILWLKVYGLMKIINHLPNYGMCTIHKQL